MFEITGKLSNYDRFSSHVKSKQNLNLDTQRLISLRKHYACNPANGYLNINSLKNKIDEFREISKNALTYFLCRDESKLDISFHDSPFKTEEYQFLPF